MRLSAPEQVKSIEAKFRAIREPWGRMLSESAAEYVRSAPWLVIFPGIAISLVVFGTNLLGDAARDLLDPRQRT